MPLLTIPTFDWPFKIIYASDGIATDTIGQHLEEFYASHPDIPANKQPNIVHVAGKTFVHRNGPEPMVDPEFPLNAFIARRGNEDVQALGHVILGIQGIAIASKYVMYKYIDVFNKMIHEGLR